MNWNLIREDVLGYKVYIALSKQLEQEFNLHNYKLVNIDREDLFERAIHILNFNNKLELVVVKIYMIRDDNTYYIFDKLYS
jgi:hypothetical protein